MSEALSLIRRGALLSTRPIQALHAAAEVGQSGVVLALLGAGAYINATTKRRQTPLLATIEVELASKPHFTCIQHLLAAKADTAISDEDGGFPLAVAAAMGNLDVVEELVRDEPGTPTLFVFFFFFLTLG